MFGLQYASNIYMSVTVALLLEINLESLCLDAQCIFYSYSIIMTIIDVLNTL